MKTNSTQQEILLITKSSVAQKQWCKKEFDNGNKNLTPEEYIEEACANGLVQELLPEVFNNNHKMYLWQMHPGFSFLQLELGEFPLTIQKEFSLDPHNFFSTIHYN